MTEVGEASKLRPTEPDPQEKLPFGPATMDARQTRGSIMTRKGTCFNCSNCGGTSGCS